MKQSVTFLGVLIAILIVASQVNAATLPVTITPENLVVRDSNGNIIATSLTVALINNTNGYVQLARALTESGTVFPTVPAVGYLYYRTDLQALYIWTGLQWVTAMSATLPPGTISYNDLADKPDLTVYLFMNGSRPLTADWNTGAYGIYGLTFLNATSITVTNLNATNVYANTIYLGNLLTDPVAPAKGQMWYNSAQDTMKYYNGTAIVIVPGIGGGSSSSYTLPYSYTIYKTGSTYYMEKYDGTLWSSTNASAVINNAIGNCSSGGKMFVKSATYVITATNVISTSKIQIEGEGKSTIFYLGANCNVFNITGTGVVQVELKNFFIWGTKASYSGTAIYINTPYSTGDTRHLIENVEISDIAYYGVQIQGDTRVVHLNQVHVNAAGYSAFIIAGTDHVISNCEAEGSQQNGFELWCASVHFTNDKAFGNGISGGTYAGWYIGQAVSNLYVGCEAQDNQHFGLCAENAAAYNNYFAGFICQDNGRAGTGYLDGVSLYAGKNYTFIGGTSYNTRVQARGFRIWGTVGVVLLQGVNVYNNTIEQITVTTTGTNIQILNCPGYNYGSDSTATYIIQSDGTYYYMTKTLTGETWSSANATQVVNYAMDNLTAGRTWPETVYIKGNLSSMSGQVQIPEYTTLLIDGSFTRAASQSANWIVSKTTNYCKFITIAGVGLAIIDGNRANQVAEANITYIQGTYPNYRPVLIENLKFQNCFGYAIVASGINDLVIRNIIAIDSQIGGVALLGVSDGIISDCTIGTDGGDEYGLYLSSSSVSNRISNLYMGGATAGGICLSSSYNNFFSNTIVNDCTYGVILMGTAHANSFVGGRIALNSQATNNTRADMYINDTCYGNLIEGIQFYEDAGSSHMAKYGIYEEATCSYNVVIGCNFQNQGTAGIITLGTSTEVHSCYNGTTWVI